MIDAYRARSLSDPPECMTVELIGLPGAGKTTLASMLVDTVQEHAGWRPHSRGQSRVGGKRALLTAALKAPLGNLVIAGVLVLVLIGVAGSLSERIARMTRVMTGLYNMLHAVVFRQPLVMDEGPINWIASVPWTTPVLFNLAARWLGVLYRRFLHCSLVYLDVDEQTRAVQRAARAKAAVAARVSDTVSVPDRHTHKRSDAERTRSLQTMRRMFRDQGIMVLTIRQSDVVAALHIAVSAGWIADGAQQ